METILLPCEVRYSPGPNGRPRITGIEALRPVHVQRWRFEGDTFVVMNDEEGDIDRWGRDRHWCLFPGSCPACTARVTVSTPLRFRRNVATRPELMVNCSRCGDIWIAATRQTLPI